MHDKNHIMHKYSKGFEIDILVNSVIFGHILLFFCIDFMVLMLYN